MTSKVDRADLARRVDADADAKLLADSKALDEAYASACGPAEAYDSDLLSLVQAARATCLTGAPLLESLAALRTALEQFEPWLEAEETPQQMGWVGKDGQP